MIFDELVLNCSNIICPVLSIDPRDFYDKISIVAFFFLFFFRQKGHINIRNVTFKATFDTVEIPLQSFPLT